MRFLKRIVRRLLPLPPQFLIAPSQVRLVDSMLGGQPVVNFAISDVPTVISFGTRDGTYDAFVQRLHESCRAAGMATSVETIPSCSRDNACLFKPTFIKLKLLTIGGPVLWLDADAVVSEAIALPQGDWDLATLPNNLRDHVNAKAALCIGFKPTVPALRFLEHWEQLCAAHWLKPGYDHRRFNYAREILAGYYREADLSEAVRGRLVRDAGRQKEQAF